MKKFFSVLATTVFLVGCSPGNSESISTSTLAITGSTSTNVESGQASIPTTTVPPISTSALPKRENCPVQKISLETSEVFKENIRCVDNWAIGIPQRFVEKFTGETDVEAEWVLTRTKGKWIVVGICNIYYPIYSSGLTCNNPYNDDSIDLDLIPPMPVQCVLWDGANFEANISETGCPKLSRNN
jgi:hypothetical protein